MNINEIAQKINTDKKSVFMSKREFVNSFNCEKRTSGNVNSINRFLESHNLKTTPNYINGNIDDQMELSYIFKADTSNFKLIYLYIDGYKNLNDLSIDFEKTDRYCTLIGLNGSGKSNIIEAICYIFYSLHQIAAYGNKSQYQCQFNYKIVYSLDGKCVEIANGRNIAKSEKVSADILPKNIIAAYSGEDTRLWEMSFKTIFDIYCGRIFAESAGFDPPFMFYISKRQWEIAMLALLYSNDVDVVQFVKSLIKGNEITISFDIEKKNTHKWDGTLTGAFIDEIKKKGTFTLTEFNDIVNSISFIDQPSTLFYLLYKASIKSDNTLISKIKISFSNGADLESLSEGEKKLILTNLIIHILASKRTLCLFDEPDSHIHISRKKDLIGLIGEENRYSVVATHSPVFTHLMNIDNIKYIENGQIKPIDAIRTISNLSGGTINYISGSLLMSSDDPLILVEGVGDVDYLKRTIEIFKSENKYKCINWDILQMGGAANAEHYINEIKPHINPSKKVIVLFDRDTAGADAMKIQTGHGDRADFVSYKKENWHFLMLPKTSDHMELDFLIEDYYSKDYKNQIAQEKINDAKGCFNKYPKDLRELVKTALRKKLNNNTDKEMQRFTILLDKLLDIVNDVEVCNILP